MTLNPARLARFADRARTLPPRPLPRTATPVPGEYYLDYTVRLAGANHLELLELTGALDDSAAVTLDPGQRKQHRQERLAAAASQPLARIARLYWDDAGLYLRDPGGFGQLLRPACRRCTARLGITGPIACRLPPHQTLCRRHRLWTGPSACTHAAQLDISPGRLDDGPGQAIVEIAIYPGVVWLAACSLRAHSASHRTASVPFR